MENNFFLKNKNKKHCMQYMNYKRGIIYLQKINVKKEMAIEKMTADKVPTARDEAELHSPILIVTFWPSSQWLPIVQMK